MKTNIYDNYLLEIGIKSPTYQLTTKVFCTNLTQNIPDKTKPRQPMYLLFKILGIINLDPNTGLPIYKVHGFEKGKKTLPQHQEKLIHFRRKKILSYIILIP